jgi:hypothetical protein
VYEETLKTLVKIMRSPSVNKAPVIMKEGEDMNLFA